MEKRSYVENANAFLCKGNHYKYRYQTAEECKESNRNTYADKQIAFLNTPSTNYKASQ